MELFKMADGVTRSELAQQKAGKSVNVVKVASGARETGKLSSKTTTDTRRIIREEIKSALTGQDRQDGDRLHNETLNKSVNCVAQPLDRIENEAVVIDHEEVDDPAGKVTVVII